MGINTSQARTAPQRQNYRDKGVPTMSMPPPQCPIHKIDLINHESLGSPAFNASSELPSEPPFLDYYKCPTCTSGLQGWIVIDNQRFYHYIDGHWMPTPQRIKPRNKGILIGERVFQP